MKTIIVANTKRQADLIAKDHGLRPWDWRYAFGPHSLQGIDHKVTILIASDWIERPIYRTDDETGEQYLCYPMTEQLHMHQMLDGEIAYVTT